MAAKKKTIKKKSAEKKSAKPSTKKQSVKKTPSKKITIKLTKSPTKTSKSKAQYTGLVIVNKGIEDIAAIEVKELIGAKTEIREGAVKFQIKNFEDLCVLSYKGQSFARVLLLLDEFTPDKESENEQVTSEDLKKIFENMNADFTIAEKLIKKNDIRFAARSTRISTNPNEPELQKSDVEKSLGEKIHTIYPNVDLTNPNMIFYAYIINNKYYIGIDFSGEIDKREYRIYSTPKEMKATIAYSLLRMGGYDKKKSILDPFSGSATIPIEAALYATNTSPRFFKKNTLQFTNFNLKFNFKKYEKHVSAKNINSSDASLHNLKSAERNAKVASVNKAVSVTRIDVEWIDTKFDENELDIICTWPVESSKEQDDKEVKKLYKEFFYQTEFVLTKKCKIVMLVKKPDSIIALKEAAAEFFKVTHERQVMQGKETLNVLVFERK